MSLETMIRLGLLLNRVISDDDDNNGSDAILVFVLITLAEVLVLVTSLDSPLCAFVIGGDKRRTSDVSCSNICKDGDKEETSVGS